MQFLTFSLAILASSTFAHVSALSRRETPAECQSELNDCTNRGANSVQCNINYTACMGTRLSTVATSTTSTTAKSTASATTTASGANASASAVCQAADDSCRSATGYSVDGCNAQFIACLGYNPYTTASSGTGATAASAATTSVAGAAVASASTTSGSTGTATSSGTATGSSSSSSSTAKVVTGSANINGPAFGLMALGALALL